MAAKSTNTSANDKRVDISTGIGVFSFPHVFKETAETNDKGETVYEIQFLISKKQREDVKAIHAAITEVAKAKWGDNYKAVRSPLRDGDKEKDMPTEDGSTRGEKYPERLGHYFLNARSKKPVSVVGRDRTPIESADLYGGCKGKLHVTFYPYVNSGNLGVGAGLNGVQKIADGESFGGGGKPAVESMFDMLEDDEDLGDGLDLDDEDDSAEAEKPKAKKKKKSKKA